VLVCSVLTAKSEKSVSERRFNVSILYTDTKGKGRYSCSSGNPTSELRDVTCHIGPHSLTCHPTQVNVLRLTPAMQAGTRFTEGWKAE